jgi:uncharacterized protein
MNEPQVIVEMLGDPVDGRPRQPRTLAVVGLSGKPSRSSYSVAAYMQQQGYRILPVNPAFAEVLGERSYASLAELPERPDVVNVFRQPEFLPAVVEEMIALGLRDLWVQLGIVNLEAAQQAEQAGLRVVMDRCILIEHRRLAG